MNKPNLEPWQEDTIYGAFVTLKRNLSVLWGKFLCSIGIHDWRIITKEIPLWREYKNAQEKARYCRRCPRRELFSEEFEWVYSASGGRGHMPILRWRKEKTQ